MVRQVPRVRNLQPGHTIVFPNREKASSKATKAIVVFILLVSVALMLAVTIGGWSKLQGLKVVNFVWCAVYLIIAFYIATRWARGLLPIRYMLLPNLVRRSMRTPIRAVMRNIRPSTGITPPIR